MPGGDAGWGRSTLLNPDIWESHWGIPPFAASIPELLLLRA